MSNVFVHDTTLATNAIIERKGRSPLSSRRKDFGMCSKLGDQGRYDQYDIYIEKPKHLIPRHLRFTSRSG